jgi:hypothetical protein
VFFDKNGILKPTDFTLTQIHRQAEGSPIIRYSRALRENRMDEIDFFGKQEGEGRLIRVPRARITMEHLARAEQLLCGRNDTRHQVNWLNGVDIPEGTKVYIKEEELGQKVEITDGPASGKTGTIINTGVHGDLRYYVVAIDGYDSSFTLVCNGEFNFI